MNGNLSSPQFGKSMNTASAGSLGGSNMPKKVGSSAGSLGGSNMPKKVGSSMNSMQVVPLRGMGM
jgi:hypothetical protein